VNIYVASSWKNTLQPSVVTALREAGHTVYDFKNPAPGDHGFSWKQIVVKGHDDPYTGGCCIPQCQGNWGTGCDHCHFSECPCFAPLRDPARFRDEVLTHPVARAAFAKDMDALRDADATVLVLPCGRSAHLELGWAAGHGQRTVVLLDTPMSEPELMYLMCNALCASMDEVLEAVLARCRCGVKAPPRFSAKRGFMCARCADEAGP
jgi:hypothetical protein